MTNKRLSLAAIAALIIVITALHYRTTTAMGHFHEIYRILYYIPIILAAFRFGLRGALVSAAAITVLYLPHIIRQWGGHPMSNLPRFLEILLYNLIALITGSLANRERRERSRYQKTAEELEASYQRLKRQSAQMTEMEEQLRIADRLSTVGELAATLAHEVRNPLASIRGSVEILRDEVLKESESHGKFLEILLKEVNRLEGVVSNYLSLVRAPRKELRRCDLVALLGNIIAIIQPRANRLGVRIKVDARLEHLHVLLPEQQLTQVLLNIMLNALAASEPGEEITIRLSAEDDGAVTIAIQDQGPGLSQETLQRIFEPFFTTKEDGTGLGLAIVRRIADKNRWQIDVESEPGAGTRFTLRLPIDDQPD